MKEEQKEELIYQTKKGGNEKDSSLPLRMTNEPLNSNRRNGGDFAAIPSPFSSCKPVIPNATQWREESPTNSKNNCHSGRSEETKGIPPVGRNDESIENRSGKDSSLTLGMTDTLDDNERRNGGDFATIPSPSSSCKPVIPNATQWREESPTNSKNNCHFGRSEETKGIPPVGRNDKSPEDRSGKDSSLPLGMTDTLDDNEGENGGDFAATILSPFPSKKRLSFRAKREN